MNKKVNGVSLTFTADTGASSTIISRANYNEIPLEARPELAEATCMVGAEGTHVDPYKGQRRLVLLSSWVHWK